MKLRIGTRGSSLALAQAGEIASRLAAVAIESELVPMVTSGDRGAPASASPAGVKGLFVAEIVRALQDGEVDLAVHSAKDLPARDDDGVIVAAVPERADPFDVLVTRDGELPDGAAVGTSSLRRRAQLLRWRSGVHPVAIRGNVDTRLRKLEEGEVDALVLAAAGLARLGTTPEHAEQLPFVPAPGQGALAVQVRIHDDATIAVLLTLDDVDSRSAVEAERSLMARLGGGCALPLGAYARTVGEELSMVAVVVSPDGRRLVRAEVTAGTPEETASEAERVLREQGAQEILDLVREDGPR
ncbi:MAG: hydroxymethylbilane synthase [Actinomycetota bacterium]